MRTALFVLLAFLLVGCGRKVVSFKEEIQPILTQRCGSCHGNDATNGNVLFASYEAFMSSRSSSGRQPLIIPGSPVESRLYVLCAINDPKYRMPPVSSSSQPMTRDELLLLKKWIEQGARDN